ncbi:Salicylate hydroxylase [Pseudocercospora fuligena]|uniref:Salicylate hydroxylase n=1 Tax=Pseudocercospora fuligena TaxID=685502 RepID=A0A8H6RPU8_9PEZI|nr:Salicylate hydroxylase [Pseudocercospora fuligena]
MALHVAVLGAGISGLASAIALKKYLPDPDAEIKITIIEIRPSPSTIGGAVNLTPKALRYLDHLGVLEVLNRNGAGAECKKIEIFDLCTGSKSAELDFCGVDGNGIGAPGSAYFARRVMRAELQSAMLEICEGLENVRVLFEKKTVSIEERCDSVELYFESGDSMVADLVLGCDGIHSACRSLLVDPGNTPSCTGVATSMATSKVRGPDQLRWQTTGLVQSRKGSFMASYFNESRQGQYIAVVVETPEVADREGWKIRGSDQKAIKDDILQRFDSAAMPELRELIEDAGDWTMCPVYQLPMGGKWMSSRGRCILIGDAAHAMPPQGESTGICIEDAIVFSRAMMHYRNHALRSILTAYERYRRPKTDAEVLKAVSRWESVKDKGWLAHKLLMLITPWYLWWTAASRNNEFSDDFTKLDFDITASL